MKEDVHKLLEEAIKSYKLNKTRLNLELIGVYTIMLYENTPEEKKKKLRFTTKK